MEVQVPIVKKIHLAAHPAVRGACGPGAALSCAAWGVWECNAALACCGSRPCHRQFWVLLVPCRQENRICSLRGVCRGGFFPDPFCGLRPLLPLRHTTCCLAPETHGQQTEPGKVGSSLSSAVETQGGAASLLASVGVGGTRRWLHGNSLSPQKTLQNFAQADICSV